MNNRYVITAAATLAVVIGLWASLLAVGVDALVGIGIGAAAFLALAAAWTLTPRKNPPPEKET